MAARISALTVQIEIQQVDDEGDEISRGTVVDPQGPQGPQQRPLQVVLFRGDLKKVKGLEEVLAEKGVKVV